MTVFVAAVEAAFMTCEALEAAAARAARAFTTSTTVHHGRQHDEATLKEEEGKKMKIRHCKWGLFTCLYLVVLFFNECCF